MTVLKPGSSNFTVYVPTLRRGNWKEPVSLVVAVCGWSSEGPVSVTVTPGSTAPDVSLTLPKISPVCDWAHAPDALSTSASAASRAVKRNFIVFLASTNEVTNVSMRA